jgi:Tfp pilus assembly protein PilF
MHNNLANVLWGTGEQAAAEKQFREALRIQPGIAEWRLNLGKVLASRGEFVEARYQFQQAARLAVGSSGAEVRAAAGDLLRQLGR